MVLFAIIDNIYRTKACFGWGENCHTDLIPRTHDVAFFYRSCHSTSLSHFAHLVTVRSRLLGPQGQHMKEIAQGTGVSWLTGKSMAISGRCWEIPWVYGFV